MPVNATGRPILSDLVKGVSSFEENTLTNFNTKAVTVGGTATIGTIGIPVVWVTANARFEVFVAQVIDTVAGSDSPLPGGAKVALLIGDKFGAGFNKADVDLSAGDVTMTALYRGDATVSNNGIVWGAVSAPNQALFLAELETQRITTIDNADVVTPSYV